MSWTTHGHHIDGTELSNDTRPSQRVRCGGPGLCGKCSAEQARALQKIREVENREVEEHWHRKPTRVVTVFWDGTSETVGPILSWLRANINPDCRLQPGGELIRIGPPGDSSMYMAAREFFVDYGDKAEVVPEDRFRIDFELEE